MENQENLVVPAQFQALLVKPGLFGLAVLDKVGGAMLAAAATHSDGSSNVSFSCFWKHPLRLLVLRVSAAPEPVYLTGPSTGPKQSTSDLRPF